MGSTLEWETEMIRISDGIYAYIQATGKWFINNAGLILGKKDTTIIDSLSNAKMADNFITEIRKITDIPFGYLINTHHHSDHIWTNHLFTGAKTICHTNCRVETLKEMSMNPKFYSGFFTEIDFEGAKVTPQDLTFEKQLTIYQETEHALREIRLVHAGAAHTTGDVFLYLPEEKVVFCGDILFAEPCTPFALMGSLYGWIHVLDLLSNLDADTYVPGHGPLSGKDAIYKARDYLTFVRDEAKKRFEEGLNVYDAVKEIDLGKYSRWGEKERIVGNVARAYSDFRGEPPGIPKGGLIGIMTRMMKYRKELEG